MPYNETIDLSVAGIIADWNVTRKKMFGGTCHLLNGNMMCGVYQDYLILRLGEDQASHALKKSAEMPASV
jgi:TfoX/Sxy family transcriptional regulator of competence genes